MLRAANEFGQLVRGGSPGAEAILTMRYNRSRDDLKLLDALENAPVDNSGYDSRMVTVSQLDALMIMDQEVRAKKRRAVAGQEPGSDQHGAGAFEKFRENAGSDRAVQRSSAAVHA
jgi:hypothetical protein